MVVWGGENLPHLVGSWNPPEKGFNKKQVSCGFAMMTSYVEVGLTLVLPCKKVSKSNSERQSAKPSPAQHYGGVLASLLLPWSHYPPFKWINTSTQTCSCCRYIYSHFHVWLFSGPNKEWTSSKACLCGFLQLGGGGETMSFLQHFLVTPPSGTIKYCGRMPGWPRPDAAGIISCMSAVHLECVTCSGSFIFPKCPGPTLQETNASSLHLPSWPASTCPYINSWVAARLAYSWCLCATQVATYWC